jgi:hypothetical protein
MPYKNYYYITLAYGARIEKIPDIGDKWDMKRKKEGNYFTSERKAQKKLTQIRRIFKTT